MSVFTESAIFTPLLRRSPATGLPDDDPVATRVNNNDISAVVPSTGSTSAATVSFTRSQLKDSSSTRCWTNQGRRSLSASVSSGGGALSIRAHITLTLYGRLDEGGAGRRDEVE
ncbi:unnamed protein product [Arctogadus glacialis]